MIVRFEPFQTVISVGFWTALAKVKLESVKLSRVPYPVHGCWYAAVQDGAVPPRFFLDERSFDAHGDGHWEEGRVLFVESEGEFRALDLKTCLGPFGGQFVFVMIVLADLKRHNFKYYMAYPIDNARQVMCDRWEPVGASQEAVEDACARPIPDMILGWPIRRLLSRTLAAQISVSRGPKSYKLSLRYSPTSQFVEGWEKDGHGKVHFKVIDLAPLMDPKKLAREASDLNLKLIKWQLVPDLDLDEIQSLKVLICGAGTLGCNVLRLLLVCNGHLIYA